MKLEKHLKNKNILITGGTGSFGHQIIKELIKIGPNSITVLSRDEKKQYDMKNEFEGYVDLLNFVIGDVRSYPTVYDTMRNIDIVYHAAALKQVPSCEFHPFEAVKTNIIGAENVKRAAIENEVDTLVSISTDKAVKPVNTMGMTKAIQEKIILNSNNQNFSTKFICVRYGNVIGSRGSVIPFFKERIEKGKFIPITSYEMTRFLLRLKEAVDLVFKATDNGRTGQLFVKKMPACYIFDLAKVMGEIIGGTSEYPIKEVGIRPGEKIHEVLVSEEEMRRAVETTDHYIIHSHGELKKPMLINDDLREYNSHKNDMLKEKEIESLLEASGWL